MHLIMLDHILVQIEIAFEFIKIIFKSNQLCNRILPEDRIKGIQDPLNILIIGLKNKRGILFSRSHGTMRDGVSESDQLIKSIPRSHILSPKPTNVRLFASSFFIHRNKTIPEFTQEHILPGGFIPAVFPNKRIPSPN